MTETCPEYGCTLRMPDLEEIRAHLRWDHNLADHEIDKILDKGEEDR